MHHHCVALGLVARAEMLYNREGIQLQGTTRIVTYKAGVCNVLEDLHSEKVYEQMKTNHGQPLHVWQLDFSAYNGTGKSLSHLRAGFEIESEWPAGELWQASRVGGRLSVPPNLCLARTIPSAPASCAPKDVQAFDRIALLY